MTHFIRIIKARSLKNKWVRFVKEKHISLFPDEYESDIESPRPKFSSKLQKKILDSSLGHFLKNLKTPNTIENIVWKSFLGFTGGILLTYIFFIFFYVGVNFSLKTTTYTCGLAGIVLCLGLAFSSKVRCYVFLLLPVFFSKQGRQALLAYALFLAFTGPAKNTMHNMGILSDSMTCGQEMVKRTLKQIIESIKTPFRSIKETLQKITKSLKEVIEGVKAFVTKIKRIIVAVLNVIKKATTWLGSIVNFCNKKIGTPFQRCMKTFDDAIADCKAKLGIMDFLCHVVHLVKALCYTVKWLDFICMFTEFVSEKVIGVVKKKLKEFGLHMKTLFYVSIDFSHSYEFETKASNTTKEITKTIFQKINSKVEKLQNAFSFFGFIFSFVFIFVFIKVYYYKYKYMTSDRYDNIYINKYIVELDIKRGQMDRETVLPLERREKKKYAKPTSLRLLKDEKSRMAESVFLLSLASFKIISFLVCDYSLFWILLTIYEAGQDIVEEPENPKFGVHVNGSGVLANFYKNLGKTFEVPGNPNMHLNPLHCLPDPVTPDLDRYIQIGFLLGLCWLLTITEPYGLRLRHLVMSHYYPDRARERAVWLYNHILRSRGSFIRFARRQLRRKFQGGVGSPIEKVTFGQRFFESFPLLRTIFGKKKQNACLLCGAPETKAEPLKRCKTPDCPGRYCLKCFASLQNICTVCQHPIEYGDISDISEEVDSSEEEFYKRARENHKTYDTGNPRNDKKHLTFQDLEIRDRFKDLEANRMMDYAKLGDLYQDTDALKRKLKEVLQKRLENLSAEKEKDLEKYDYKRVTKKLRDLISKLKQKKSEHKVKKSALKKRISEKIDSMKSYELKGNEEDYEHLLGDEGKPSRSRVSFNLDLEKQKPHLPRTKAEYEILKNEVKEKIKLLEEKKNLNKKSWGPLGEGKSESKDANGYENSKQATFKGDKSSPENFDKAELTYYFIERGRQFEFCLLETTLLDEILNF